MKKPEPPKFKELLARFELEARSHQMEEKADMRSCLKQDLERTRSQLLEMFHRARFGARP